MSGSPSGEPRIVLVGGGVRSGKSAFALRRARELGPRRVFVAPAQAVDDEMRERIARHRAERGASFLTVEEPLEVPERLAALVGADVVVVDCLTLWLSNLLLRGDSEARIADSVESLSAVVAERRFHTVMVTNEVGLGVVPEHRLGRVFRDVAGRAHQRLAAQADEVYVGMMGLMLELKPRALLVAPEAGKP